MMSFKYWRIALFALLLLIPSVVTAQEDFNYILSNSESWTDVYSTTLYSNLLAKESGFLVSEKHAVNILNGLPKQRRIRVITSEDFPFFLGYEDYLQSLGYNEPQELIFDNVNIGLAELLPEVRNFIVIDDSYGYNAVAVAPYAAVKKAYVLFADQNTVDDVADFLNDREIDEILIYGHVDREVKEGLADFNPEIINEEDRFDNNVEIVKKYREIRPAKQVILSNGEFIEREIMSGAEPVLFVGRENVPEQIKDYIQSTDIEVAVLIGNELVGTATNVRRDVGISVFVKFAQGSRGGGSISAVEGLDLFYVPTASLDLRISSVKYNTATDQLEVTYQNAAQLATYVRGTLTLNSDAGGRQRFGDINPVFIEANELKTITYSDINITGEKFTLEVFSIYGESPNSLEFTIQKTVDVDVISILDNCEITVEDVAYHKGKSAFEIDVKNVGEAECYVDVQLVDVLVADEKFTFALKDTSKLLPAKSRRLLIRAELDEYDLSVNPYVTVLAYYGQREESLTKIFRGEFELKVKVVDVAFYTVVLIVIILLVIFIFLLKRDREKKKRYQR
ncbi:hypothetical protein HY501_03105 [Candidatus Woesearchaeota archaeon]|nr:hypothetical protein [Candidatus Woesearchaeota archaeon]